MRVLILIACALLFSGCGGGGGGGGSGGGVPLPLLWRPPGAPGSLTANAGDGAVSIGWQAPSSNGGVPITGYEVQISPAVAANDIYISGTRAVIANLSNGVTYTVSVAARNLMGTGAASGAVDVQPNAASESSYDLVSITGDSSPNGVYDPSLVRDSLGTLWMSYSSVHFYVDGAMNRVQDVGTRVARSTDNGASFDWVNTVASPAASVVTDTDPAKSACGSTTCSGRWVYETSTLVEDPDDPDPNRRFKLFAHKYFLIPDTPSSKTLYHLGAIVMWTASTPDATWSSPETVVLRWPLTPSELVGGANIAALSTELAGCLTVAEPGVTVRDGNLYMVFACPYIDTGPTDIKQKIVLLRSTDHGVGFQYVNTLLTAADAALFGLDHYSAPSLIATEDRAPVLLVTPVVSGQYAGSMVFPFAGTGLNTLFQLGGVVLPIHVIPVQATGHVGGASTYARGMGSVGVLQSDAVPATPIENTSFRIIRTHTMAEL